MTRGDKGLRTRKPSRPAAAVRGARPAGAVAWGGVATRTAVASLLVLHFCGCGYLTRLAIRPTAPTLYATGTGRAAETAAPGVEPGGKSAIAPEGRRRPGPNYPKWGEDTIEVKGSAPVSQEAASYVEGIMLARQAARDDACRQLAARVAALPAPTGGTTLGEVLKGRPNDRTEVEKMIRACELVPPVGAAPESRGAGNDAGVADGQYRVSARLSLAPMALLLYGEAAESPARAKEEPEPGEPAARRLGNVRIPADPLQRAAFDRALRDARRQMLEELGQVYLLPNYSVGDLLAVNPDAAARARYEVESYARVDAIRYPRPGACEVDLSLNPGPTLRVLKSMMR